MDLEGELSKLSDLHDQGQLTDEAYAEAKAKAIEAVDAASSADGNNAGHRDEIAKLDQAWRVERRSLSDRDSQGFLRRPSKKGAIIGNVGLIVFAILWVINTRADKVFMLIGPLIAVAGLLRTRSEFRKAETYDSARSSYVARRDSLAAQADQEHAKRREL